MPSPFTQRIKKETNYITLQQPITDVLPNTLQVNPPAMYQQGSCEKTQLLYFNNTIETYVVNIKWRETFKLYLYSQKVLLL